VLKGTWFGLIRSVEVTGKELSFWLYIAAPETPASGANRKMRRLSPLDSFVINRAEMKNRISLGLYSSKNAPAKPKLRIQNLSGVSC